jgi:hypothetical protein
MSIETIYKNILIEKYLKDNLQEGNTLSAFELIEQAEIYHDSLNIDATTRPQPLFDVELREVVRFEEASASKMNNTFNDITLDLKVAFIEMGELNTNSLRMFKRWQIESESIRKELIDLEDKIENLLLVTQDTEGYHSIIVDNLTDSLNTDLIQTTAALNIETRTVTLKSNNDSTTVKNIDPEPESVSFKIRAPILQRNDMPGTNIEDVFNLDPNKVWHTVLEISTPQTVICELGVKLADTALKVNRIEISTLEAGQSGPISVTPMHSLDNLTFSALPIDNYTAEVRDVANFFFPETEMKYVKFLIVKTGPDPSEAVNSFSYQFGFRSIKFYEEGFDIGDDIVPQVFETNWLSIAAEGGGIKPFEKAVLKTCEMIPANTKINYYLAASGVNTETASDWYKITPLDREILETAEKIFDIGQVTNMEFDDIGIYGNNVSTGTYLYVSDVAGILTKQEVEESEANHYLVENEETDGFLNCLLYNEDVGVKKKINLNEPSLVVWRNIGKDNDSTDATGWRFEDPYYYTVVNNKEAVDIEIDNYSIEVGTNHIFIQQENSPATIPKGISEVRVHKDHYEVIRKTIQNNVDFYAERKLERVSIFDMLNNIPDTDYSKYSLDMSLPKNQEDTSKRIIVVKTSSDRTTETFKIEFNQINQLRNYIKLKAELSTSDSTLTPCITGYQLKLG